MALVRSRRALIWFSALLFFVAACGNNADTARKPVFPAAAEQVMTSAIDTMFTWTPTVDAGPAAAFTRAAPFLSASANAANQAVAKDTVAGWEKWRKNGAKVEADVTVGAGLPSGAPADTDSLFTRSVRVVQRVVGPDGGTTETFTFTLDRVAVTLTGAKWLVDSISNLNRAGGGLCPAGQVATSGTCSPQTSTPAPTSTTVPVTTNNPAPITTNKPAPITTVPPPCMPGDPACSPPNPCAAPGSCQPPPCMPGDPACSPPNPCAEPGSCEPDPYNPADCTPGLLCVRDSQSRPDATMNP